MITYKGNNKLLKLPLSFFKSTIVKKITLGISCEKRVDKSNYVSLIFNEQREHFERRHRSFN